MTDYIYKGKTNHFFTNGKTYDIQPFEDEFVTKDDTEDSRHEISNDYIKNFTPVFTQEMADTGTLPSDGIKCLHTGLINGFENPFKFKDGDVVEIISAYEDGVIFRRENHDTLGLVIAHTCNPKHFKPLTPLIELIDGKAYQFDYDAGSNVILDNINGLYDNGGSNAVFWVKGNAYYATSCANIQLLEVIK